MINRSWRVPLVVLLGLSPAARADLPPAMRDFAGQYRLLCGGHAHRLVLGVDGSVRLDGQPPSAENTLLLSLGWSPPELGGPAPPRVSLELTGRLYGLDLLSIAQGQGAPEVKSGLKACTLAGGHALPRHDVNAPLAALAQHQRLRCTVNSEVTEDDGPRRRQVRKVSNSGIDSQAEISAAGVASLTPAWVPSLDESRADPMNKAPLPYVAAADTYALQFRQHFDRDGAPAQADYQGVWSNIFGFFDTSTRLEFDADGALRRWYSRSQSEGLRLEWDCRG